MSHRPLNGARTVTASGAEVTPKTVMPKDTAKTCLGVMGMKDPGHSIFSYSTAPEDYVPLSFTVSIVEDGMLSSHSYVVLSDQEPIGSTR